MRPPLPAAWSALSAEYRPGTGMVFRVGAEFFDGGHFRPAALLFTLNQATGAIGAGFE